MSKVELRKELAAFMKQHGVLPADGAPTACHLWNVDENGYVTPTGEHEGSGLNIVVIPSGKFIVPETKCGPVMTDEQWICSFAHLDELPENPMRISPLIDAPSPPEELNIRPPVIIHVPDAKIGTGGDPNAHDRPLAIDPKDIDRDAVPLDLEKFRKERAGDTAPKPEPKRKARTFEERAQQMREEMVARFEAERLAQQQTETNAPLTMAMAPTITEWKGH
ncbi:hypothetical protein [Rhizobium laguerreae]|uniref:hypothetical protein n=1 Tax=Rhizobium laguerreae TaxID=1076926 RepID=UPI001C9258C0|nr:hypothetical protein [Rhizobium laguerreae]MBY3194240.1 hypothetical protein [Rhizobium laguerreae]